MNSSKTYSYALGVAALVLILHIIGLEGQYWKFPLYDVFMHMLGGASVALLFAAITLSNAKEAKFRRTFVILAVVAVGLAWEYFEIRYGLTGYPVGSRMYYFDTMQDLVNDFIGALVVALALFRR